MKTTSNKLTEQASLLGVQVVPKLVPKLSPTRPLLCAQHCPPNLSPRLSPKLSPELLLKTSAVRNMYLVSAVIAARKENLNIHRKITVLVHMVWPWGCESSVLASCFVDMSFIVLLFLPLPSPVKLLLEKFLPLVAWLVVWFAGRLAGWLFGCLAGCLAGCLVGCLAGCLVGLPGWLSGWLLVWLPAGWLPARSCLCVNHVPLACWQTDPAGFPAREN